jgi:HlyD family secretion protein
MYSYKTRKTLVRAKRYLRPGLVMAGLAIAVGAALGIARPEAAEITGLNTQTVAPSLTVAVVTPERAMFTRSLAASGSIRARDELVIGSDAAGVRLLEVLVDVGSHVKQGDLLARADSAQLRTQLAQQQAQIAQAKAELELAQANLDRAELLGGAGVYSEEAVQTRRSAAAAAGARHDLAQARFDELQVMLAQTEVHAPANGIIASKSATVGAVVQPGMELFRLIKDGELEWHAELPASALAEIDAGAVAEVALDNGSELTASVRMVAPTLNASTRNGIVYISLPASNALRAGSHAQGEIVLAAAEVLAVPESAVLIRDGYPFVYVVDGNELAHLEKVQTGARQHGLVEISSGLDEHARVVTTGAGFVKEGELVRVVATTSQGNEQGGVL